jgi:hypothetical protein
MRVFFYKKLLFESHQKKLKHLHFDQNPNMSPATTSATPGKTPIRGPMTEDVVRDLNLAHSLARDLEQAKKDPNTSIEKIEELASRAWQANVAIEKRQIQVCPSFVYL